MSILVNNNQCNCLAGEDFNRNLYIPTIDFATIHVYREHSTTSFHVQHV
jgi:hypothetical protein